MILGQGRQQRYTALHHRDDETAWRDDGSELAAVTAALQVRPQLITVPRVRHQLAGNGMTKVRCATAIVKTLEAVGTDVVFGYNGHGNWALLDSFEYESNVKCVTARGEHQAVHMADGYFRARHNKAIPIVSTSVGPGNMNIASALSNAFFESSAMLVLAGGGRHTGSIGAASRNTTVTRPTNGPKRSRPTPRRRS